MPAKDPLVYVMHIRDSCRRIAGYVADGGPGWISKPMVMDANPALPYFLDRL
jgi:hypothetical protein